MKKISLLILVLLAWQLNTDRAKAAISEPIQLKDNWRLYWNQKLSPENIPSSGYIFTNIGRNWNGIHAADGTEIESFGLASYYLEIKDLDAGSYELYLPKAGSAFNLSIYPLNAPERIQTIKRGKSGFKEDHAPSRKNAVLAFELKEKTSYGVILEISNWELARGGAFYPLILAPERSITKRIERTGLLELICLGITSAIALSAFFIWLRRKTEYASLALAIASFSSSLRLTVTSSWIVNFISDSYFSWTVRFEYLPILLGPVSFLLFLAYSFKFSLHYRAFKVLLATNLFLIVFVLLAPVFYVTQALLLIRVTMGLTSLFFIPIIIHALKEKMTGSILFLTGSLCVLIALIVDTYLSSNHVTSLGFTPFAATINLVFYSQILGIRAAEAQTRSESLASQLQHLTDNLQDEIAKQTQKLQQQRDKLIEQKHEIVRAHDELQDYDQQKTRFFQNISHELRTPLTLIISSLEGLDPLAPDMDDISIAERNAKRLLRLVNQLLDFQKVTQMEKSFELSNIQLNSFLKSCADYIEPACKAKSITFHTDGLELNNSYVRGQIDALEKIIFNYLSNALKFTPIGGEITLKLQANPELIRISVIDSGDGIEESKKSKLFQIFTQINSHYHVHGTGLGLALVKELATKLGGQVGVNTKLHVGSEFWIELPRIIQHGFTDILVYDPNHHIHDQDQVPEIIKNLDYVCIREFNRVKAFLKTNHVAIFAIYSPGSQDKSKVQEVKEEHPNIYKLALIDGQDEQFDLDINSFDICIEVHNTTNKNDLKQIVEKRRSYLNRKIIDVVIASNNTQKTVDLISALQEKSLSKEFKVISSAKALVDELEEYRFKVAIVDIHLNKHKEGLEILAHLKHYESETKLLAINQFDSDVIKQKILSYNAHLLNEPIHNEHVITLVNDFIESSNITGQFIDETKDYRPKDWYLSEIEIQNETENREEPAYATETSNHLGNILVCDDIKDMRRLIRKTLTKIGYSVVEAANGQEALEKCKLSTPDLIITDWMMPIMSGPEFITELHNIPEFSTIPTILLTAKSDDESKQIGTRVGATSYLSKPFEEFELQTLVKNLIELKQGEKRISELNRYLTETVLCRFLPPKLVEQAINGSLVITQTPTTTPVSILFADLVGFTSVSEQLGPLKIATVLNHFLETMSRIIFSHEGTIDKYIGDAIMVIFGAPDQLSPREQIQRAIACAFDMQEALRELNLKWLKQGLKPFQMRIGMHHGDAVVGQFGSEIRSEYTAIGPTVNYAARVQAIAKPNAVFATESICNYSDFKTNSNGFYNLKGIGEVEVFEIINEKKEDIDVA